MCGSDYIIILCGAMFDFADVTKNGILCWNIQFTYCVFYPRPILIREDQCFYKKKKQETKMQPFVPLRRGEKRHFDILFCCNTDQDAG